MRKRENPVLVRLNKEELHTLKHKVAQSGLKQEVFLRKLILCKEIRARPQHECVELLSEVRGMRKAVNQIARIACAENKVPAQDVRLLITRYTELIAAAKLLV